MSRPTATRPERHFPIWHRSVFEPLRFAFVRAEQAIRQPAYQQLAEDLRARIVSGQLRPGDRLPTEPQLCATSGLSRSTVREALRLLASQHLITTTRGVTGGSFVSRPSTAALADSLSTALQMLLSAGPVDGQQVLEVRELIEVPAAGLAATRATPEQVAALRAALFDPDTSDLDSILAAQRAFHTTLTAAVGNPLLELMSQPLNAIENEHMLTRGAGRGFWARIDVEHRAILDGVVARDPVATRVAVAHHVRHLHEAHAAALPAAGVAEPGTGPAARAGAIWRV